MMHPDKKQDTELLKLRKKFRFNFSISGHTHIPRIEEKDTAEIPLMRMPEVEPEFPGGEAALIKFIQSSVRYPENARAEGIQENVYVNFIVDEKGKVTNVECMGNPNKWLKEEALRIINLMPVWKPGKQGGRPVRVILNQPIYFKLK